MNSLRLPALAGLLPYSGCLAAPRAQAFARRSLFGLAGLLLGAAAPAAILFSDSFESGGSAWVPDGTWNLTTEAAASPIHCATDSPGSFYTNNTDASATLATAVSLAGRVRPVLAFRHNYSLEQNYDFGCVEISVDGGATWAAPLASYSGEVAAFRDEQLDLSAYGSATNFKIRFRLLTDDSVIRDGWHVDDVRLGEAPAAVTLAAPSAVARTSLGLSWSAAAGSFSAYEIYRSATPGLDWRTAWRVGTVATQGTTTFTDITVSPKTAYYYRLVVVDADGLRTASNEVSATTLAGMDFPLLDDGEGGGRTWVADAPWGLSPEFAVSGALAWSDSPGANVTYQPGIASQALTLAAPVNLAAANNPVLCFTHRHSFAGGDYGLVEVSTNNGTDWTALTTFGGTSVGWQRGRLALSAYKQAAVLVRFRLTSDPGDTADGWHIDDISLSDAPSPVPAPVVAATGSTSVNLSWQQSADPMFSHYLVVRSMTPGAGLNSVLVATVAGAANTTFSDTGLLLDTNYYYRVYAVNSYGGISADSPTEAQVRTLNNPPPFAEGFEGGLSAWLLNGTWAATTESAHGGTRSLTDSPGASYSPSTDTYAETSVDLRGTTWPVLTFWDRYAMGGNDLTRVEVFDPTTGLTLYLYGTYDVATRTEWRRQQIDLSPFKGRATVRIRFRVSTDGGTPADGWFIDDVAVAENPTGATTQTLPLFESFESGADNWLASGWTVQSDGSAPDGTHSILDTEAARTAPDTSHMLTLARPIVLPAGSNVQVTLRARGSVPYWSSFRLQYSIDGGVSWPDLSTCNLDSPFNSGANWVRLQASLQTLAGQTIRLRLATNSDAGARAEDIWIDKLTIAEMPAAVTLSSAVPALRSVALTWTPSTLGAAFRRYEVWRSTSANVTVLNGTKVIESTEAATTSFTDTGLAIGVQYFYRVFTVDERDTFIPSNELAATTVPAGLPFADTMDSAANWVPGTTGAPNTWSVCTTNPHSGTGCLAVVASGQYANNADTWMETAIDLRGTTWPVLTFWDRYAMGGNDLTRVEVFDPTTGMTQYLYGTYDVATRTEWRRQQIDLSPFRGRANVRIRFRVGTDGGTPADGWFIDDVAVAENPTGASAQTLPLLDSFEGGAGNWLASGWSVQTDATAPDGAQSILDTESARTAPDTSHMLTLARPIVLPAGSNVQVTFRARGSVPYWSSFRLQYSIDGGVSWPDLGTCNLDSPFNSGANWVRLQASLQTLAGQTIRLRLTTNSDAGARAVDVWIDKLTIAEMPAAVTLSSAVPALRSVALAWTPSALGAAFRRYEVWRSTSANVTVANGVRVAESTDVGTTSFTDTGLAIGVQYFYRVFVVDERDTFIPSNEMAATTVPAGLPFADPMDSAANWVPGTTGAPNTWGVCTTAPHSGTGCLAVAPVGQYANSADTWMETALDLRGTTWPVLTFWDRYAMGGNDLTRVEVFDPTTGMTLYLYGTYDVATRTEWRRQQIDLSPFKGRANVRIRFHVSTDGGTPADGWFIDDVAVAENPTGATAQTLPLFDSFESGAGNWLASGWSVQSDATAPDGTHSILDTESARTAPDTSHMLTLARPIVLPAGSNVQVTFRARGSVPYWSSFRLQYSVDGGVNWPELGTCNLDPPFSSGANWVRLQASLQTLAGQTIRLRLATNSDAGARAEDIWIDKLTIAEMPAAVTLSSAVPALRSVALTWTPSTLGAAFRRYEVWRSTSANVTVFNGTKVIESTELATTSFTDTGLAIGVQYFYRVFTVDERDTFIPSNELAATTVPAGLPFADTMDSAANWVPGTTGAPNTWGVCTTDPHSGTGCLAVAPVGQYANSADTWMETALDLRGTTWPVLTFWDRYAMGGNDLTRVEVFDPTTGMTLYLYGTYDVATRTEWRRQQIDLSPFKGRANVRIRFHVSTDGGTPADGWFIDDVAVAENPTGATAQALPLFDSFESGAGNWLASGWSVQSDATAPDGTHSILDTESARTGIDTSHMLTLARPIVLPAGSNVQATLYVRGSLPYWSWFRLQYSVDGGLNWTELPACNLDSPFNSGANWVRLQASLQSLAGQTLRLRLTTNSDAGARAEDIWVDSFGLGEQPPLAPVPLSPIDSAWVTAVRPTLRVQNAIDLQSDPLTYRFEVYSDAALTALVAQNPGVATGAGSTSWQVDTNLANNTQYWWRAQAHDGANSGAWSAAATFYVNEVNHPPTTPEQLGPADGAVLFGDDDWLFWRESTDGDAGDHVVAYHIQASKTLDFTAPVVDDATIVAPLGDSPESSALAISLSALAGAGGLEPGAAYYWRIRAEDNRLGWSDWQAEPKYFRYFTTAPTEFQHWQAAVFTVSELNAPLVSAESADSDGDGLCNLLEFAFGDDPRAPESAAQPVVQCVGGYMQVTYRQHAGGVGTTGVDYTVRNLRYTVEVSTTMAAGSWQSGAGVVELVAGSIVPNDDGTETVTVRAKTPITAAPRQFLRLKVDTVTP